MSLHCHPRVLTLTTSLLCYSSVGIVQAVRGVSNAPMAICPLTCFAGICLLREDSRRYATSETFRSADRVGSLSSAA